jgi:hypothetical protein
MLKVFRILSIAGSTGLISTILFSLSISENELGAYEFLQIGMVIFLFAQLVYAFSTRKIIAGKKYHDLDTLDTSWAYEEEENQAVISNNMLLISMAVMGGLVWIYNLFVFAITVRAIFYLDLANHKQLMFLFALVSQFIGAIPSIIYNVRTWNKNALA